MRTISLDIETYSEVSLSKCGVYRYAASPNFEVLLLAYSVDGGPVEQVDLAGGDRLPAGLLHALLDDGIEKSAFNSNFERVCLSHYLSRLIGKPITLNPTGWHCSMTQAALLGLPLSLEEVGRVLGMKQQKMSGGRALVRYFCTPCQPTVANGGRTRNLPADSPEKWEQFKQYNRRDVEVELALREVLAAYPIPARERQLFSLDQQINDRGLLVDLDLVEQAVACDRQFTAAATARAYQLTGLANPNSVVQLKAWLAGRGVKAASLARQAVTRLAEKTEGEVAEVLKLRLLMAKTSVKKYEAIARAVCSDRRVHGLLQFYGANRTGRWAGRLVQIQNLPQNHLKDLQLARDLVKDGRFADVELLFGETPSVLSELVRTAFVPEANHRFIVADFSAIEARVLSWLAGEKWRLDVFASHGRIYEAAAAMMFHVPVESITRDSELRQKGKIAELACGYGGGVGALKAMGALELGVAEHELQGLIDHWRAANPHIVNFWWAVDKAAIQAVKQATKTRMRGITFAYQDGLLLVTLPSGRNLAYVKPRLRVNKFGGDGLTYEGTGAAKKWERLETYGPKIVENIVQAISRDILAEAMLRLDQAGYNIVAHVHDEVICEVPEGFGSVAEVCRLMSEPIPWAQGLPLRADGYECAFYRKE